MPVRLEPAEFNLLWEREQGSVRMAAESAITEYQNVIRQLDLIMAGYQNQDDALKDHLRRLRP